MKRSVVLLATWAITACGKVDGYDPSEQYDAGPGGAGASHLDSGSSEGSLPKPPRALGDAGPVPPPYCVPPCLWELVRDCTPPAAAVCETSGTEFMDTITCDPSSGWSERRVVGGSAGTRVTVSHGGIECLSMHSGGKSPFPGIIYSSGSGTTVYRSYDGTQARCGGPNAPAIELEFERPECDPWRGTDNQLVPALGCAATVPGDCTPRP